MKRPVPIIAAVLLSVTLHYFNSTMLSKGKFKGNVSGAIGYWAGYGIDIREMICTKRE